MRDSVVNSSDRPYQIIERNDRPQFLRKPQAIAPAKLLRETSDRCGKLSDSVAWRKPYQDFQDFRIYRMRDSVVNSSDRPYQIIERNDRPQFLRETQAIAPAKLLRELHKKNDPILWDGHPCPSLMISGQFVPHHKKFWDIFLIGSL